MHDPGALTDDPAGGDHGYLESILPAGAPAMSDLTEDELRVAVMKADLYLKTRQGWWETPRNIAILVGTLTVFFASLAGIAGYKLGSQPPQAIVVQFQQPLAVKMVP